MITISNSEATTNTTNELIYLHGFNNHHQTEAILDALPKNQNSPQKVPMGLYAEQLSGSAFTVNRAHNKHSWCYRIQPSVVHEPFTESAIANNLWQSPPFNKIKQAPNQYRWSPANQPNTSGKNEQNFITGITTIAGFGDPKTLTGASASIFYANSSMSDNNLYFSNHDAEMLVVMQQGSALFTTEFGCLEVSASNNCYEIIVIPRGIRFKVDLISNTIAGYICENFGNALQLPELGPIGANGLANPRDFLYPTANFEQQDFPCLWICKYQGNFWQSHLKSSPCNIVAWHGNYAPYKYNLNLFNTLNTVSFDHPDPSIFTVLTSSGEQPGVANVDFVIFPPRWMVAENTFRPPYFHRNIMSEFMGLLNGIYDAKPDGFLPGGYSLHNRMAPHGPDYNTVKAAEQVNLTPKKYDHTLAFMFESYMAWDVTENALKSAELQQDYYKCWQDIPNRF